MAPRVPRPARVFTGALLLGAVGAALAPAGPDALLPFKMLAASAADEVYVAVIVDFGSGSSLQTIEQCAPVPAGSTDSDALAAAVSSVAYNNTGLLCAINGYPQNGVQNCNAGSGSNYYFWSYWHGSTGTWSYANNGPAGQVASDGDVEGWRFQNPGPANPSAPPPSVAPAYAQICGTHTAPTSTTTTNTAAPAQQGGTPTTTLPAGSAPSPTTAPKGSTAAGHNSTVTSSPSRTITTTSTAPGARATTTIPAGQPKGPTVHGGKSSSASASPHHSAGSGGDALLPIILVGTVIALLGALTVIRWRRRPAGE